MSADGDGGEKGGARSARGGNLGGTSVLSEPVQSRSAPNASPPSLLTNVVVNVDVDVDVVVNG
ncbi:hypothetical protein [Sorangium sp. So ce145]|uniref:hypothetical protein n=1 Tax=Sorangium sp. So ce145 TaxID=3133285 RepID=UPI003F5DA11F